MEALTATHSDSLNLDHLIDNLFTAILDTANAGELFQSIQHWKEEAQLQSGDNNDQSVARKAAKEKAKQHLDKFYTMRKISGPNSTRVHKMAYDKIETWSDDSTDSPATQPRIPRFKKKKTAKKRLTGNGKKKDKVVLCTLKHDDSDISSEEEGGTYQDKKLSAKASAGDQSETMQLTDISPGFLPPVNAETVLLDSLHSSFSCTEKSPKKDFTSSPPEKLSLDSHPSICGSSGTQDNVETRALPAINQDCIEKSEKKSTRTSPKVTLEATKRSASTGSMASLNSRGRASPKTKQSQLKNTGKETDSPHSTASCTEESKAKPCSSSPDNKTAKSGSKPVTPEAASLDSVYSTLSKEKNQKKSCSCSWGIENKRSIKPKISPAKNTDCTERSEKKSASGSPGIMDRQKVTPNSKVISPRLLPAANPETLSSSYVEKGQPKSYNSSLEDRKEPEIKPHFTDKELLDLLYHSTSATVDQSSPTSNDKHVPLDSCYSTFSCTEKIHKKSSIAADEHLLEATIENKIIKTSPSPLTSSSSFGSLYSKFSCIEKGQEKPCSSFPDDETKLENKGDFHDSDLPLDQDTGAARVRNAPPGNQVSGRDQADESVASGKELLINICTSVASVISQCVIKEIFASSKDWLNAADIVWLKETFTEESFREFLKEMQQNQQDRPKVEVRDSDLDFSSDASSVSETPKDNNKEKSKTKKLHASIKAEKTKQSDGISEAVEIFEKVSVIIKEVNNGIHQCATSAASYNKQAGIDAPDLKRPATEEGQEAGDKSKTTLKKAKNWKKCLQCQKWVYQTDAGSPLSCDSIYSSSGSLSSSENEQRVRPKKVLLPQSLEDEVKEDSEPSTSHTSASNTDKNMIFQTMLNLFKKSLKPREQETQTKSQSFGLRLFGCSCQCSCNALSPSPPMK